MLRPPRRVGGTMRDRRRRRPRRTTLFVMLVTLLLGGATVAVTATAGLTAEVRRQRWPGSGSTLSMEVESLDGGGNNKAHPDWGKAGGNYARIAPANYADGKSQPVSGLPNTRFISNRIF